MSDEQINDIANSYLKSIGNENKTEKAFMETFETDDFPVLNQRLRLFIAAEEITPSVSKVSRFLRQVHGIDVTCVRFSIFQTESGEVLVNSEAIVGFEDIVNPKKIVSQRWDGDKPVKEIIREKVREFTAGDKKKIFSPKDICQLILQQYPTFNKNTVSCRIMSDSVNHTSRHHYPGGQDLYWWLEKGKYRLYDEEKDK